MTVKEGHRLNPQPGGEGIAEGDFPLRLGDCRRDGGNERRQFRLEAGATGLCCRAVAAVAQTVAVARLAAALPCRYSNRADFPTPSLLGCGFDIDHVRRILHSGRITRAKCVWISARRRNTVIPWVALRKINFSARG